MDDRKPVLITGATGYIGRAIVDDLVRAGVPVRALSRRPDDARLPGGVEVFGGDLTVPASLDAALDGVSAVFLLWTAPPETVLDVIDRIASHAERVVFLSSPHQTAHPFFQQTPDNPMARLQRLIEHTIAESGIASTIIRPGMFASNALHWWAPSIRSGSVVRWPYGAAQTAPIDERDVASVAARVLCDVRHAGGDYVLTGPESLSQADQVRIIGEVIGRELWFEELSEEEFRREAAAWPAPVLDMLLKAWKAAVGQPAYVTTAVFDITGVKARSFRDWVQGRAAEW